ncbi:MAG: hypothetical protein FWD78_10560 [Treponema sp.]|nr:hypothetical protein [Treponema sp.]
MKAALSLTGGKKFFLNRSFQLIILIIILIGCLFAGCAGQQKLQPPLREKDPPAVRDYSRAVIDYKNKDKGAAIPDWVTYYYEGNISAIESLPEFENYYVFISHNTGANFNALNQWNAAFTCELDFARLAAVRIENRFLNAAVNYPDDEYGSYYESLVRAASDAQWDGASRKDDFWLYYGSSGGSNSGGNTYDFLVLAIIRKDLLQEQIKKIFSNLTPEDPVSREQRAAFNRVQDRFFDGF